MVRQPRLARLFCFAPGLRHDARRETRRRTAVARGFDHIVHAVRDLDAAAALYRRLGFTAGARNTHPPAWGTQNHIVQLPGTFIELLALGDTRGMVPHAPRHFSFGAFNRDFLTRGEGLSMLVLQGQGAADADDFRRRGIGDFELFDFERSGTRPDGTAVKVAFSLAFAADPKAGEIGFFTCQHHYPENFWNPAFQRHANGATAVTGVVMAADTPAKHRDFLLAFTGTTEARADGDGYAIALPRGTLAVMTPSGFADRYGVAAPAAAQGARLAALRFAAADLAATRRTLEQAGVAITDANGAIVVGPDAALGATLVFTAAA